MNQNRRIRRAQKIDVDAISAIESYWPTAPHWSKNQIQLELLREDSIFLVMEKDGPILGYCFARIFEKEARLLSLSTHPDQLRKGVAKELLGSFLKEAKRRRCSQVTLEVSKINGAALRLYQMAGFKVVGKRPKFYNDGSDALLMDISLC